MTCGRKLRRKGESVTHEIGTREVQPQTTACIRVTTTPAEIGPVMGQILPEVWGYLEEQGVHPAGPPFARYHAYQENQVDLEAGFPVSKPVAGAGRIAAGALPGGEVAVAWHVGPYDTLPTTYKAVEAWSQSQNREPAGSPWEVYWTDPGETPDTEEWRTEVIWPVKAVVPKVDRGKSSAGITRVGIVGVSVSNQDRALDFYVNALGFEKRVDEYMSESARWIEVAPTGAETRLVLEPGLEDRMDTSWAGMIFESDDIRATYEELRGRGVEFTEEPSEQPWGVWARFKDTDGNEFGLIQQ